MNLSIKQELETFYEKEVWADVTLGEALENWTKRFGENTAITFEGEDYSYEELNKKASRAGAGLLSLGFKPEDKIVVQLPNSFEFVALVFGMFKVGIVPIFALPAQRKNEIFGIIDTANAVGYVVPDTYMGFDYLALASPIEVRIADCGHAQALSEKPEEIINVVKNCL